MTAHILDARGNPLVPSALDTAHRAASRSLKELATWDPAPTSAHAELDGERDTLVARARDLERNDALVSAGHQTHIDNIVGAHFRLSARPDYVALGRSKDWADEWARYVEARWRSFADSTDIDMTRRQNFHGLTSLVLASGISTGEAFALPLWVNDRPNRTAIQLIDSERVSTPPWADKLKVKDGVEENRYGEAAAYHIAKVHPGDHWAMLGAPQQYERIPTRTPWGRLRVLHVLDQKRIGQKRGKPWVSAIMSDFQMLAHYNRYEMKNAIVNSMITAFIKTQASMEDIAALFNADFKTMLNQRSEWQANLDGGAVIPLFPGDEVQPFTPSRPGAVYGQFVDQITKRLASGWGLPRELLTKDFSKTNYSSARAALAEAWRFFLNRRRWLSDHWATPVYRLWLEDEVSRGNIEAPGFYENVNAYTRARWIGAGRGWIDPVKEAQAAKLRIASRLSTLEDECAEQGRDWEEVLEQQARESEKLRELGLEDVDLSEVMAVEAPTDKEENAA